MNFNPKWETDNLTYENPPMMEFTNHGADQVK